MLTANGDGDGIKDKDEHLARTDPLDPASALRIAAIAPGGIQVGASGPTTQGKVTSRTGPKMFFRLSVVPSKLP